MFNRKVKVELLNRAASVRSIVSHGNLSDGLQGSRNVLTLIDT